MGARGSCPSIMSFLEDQKIVERLWVPSHDSAPLIPRLREEYFNSCINPRALGLLCISLGGSSFGGSLVYGQQDVINPQVI